MMKFSQGEKILMERQLLRLEEGRKKLRSSQGG
jgi:hypothetical protein